MKRIEMSDYRSVGPEADAATTQNVVTLHNVVEQLVEAHNAQCDQQAPPEPTGFEDVDNANLLAAYASHFMNGHDPVRRSLRDKTYDELIRRLDKVVEL